MSNMQSTSQSFYSASSSSYSSDGQQHTESGHRYTTTSHTEPDGTTTVRTIQQDLGQPVIVEERRFDEQGRELAALPDAKSEGMTRRIEDVDEEDDFEKTG